MEVMEPVSGNALNNIDWIKLFNEHNFMRESLNEIFNRVQILENKLCDVSKSIEPNDNLTLEKVEPNNTSVLEKIESEAFFVLSKNEYHFHLVAKSQGIL